MAFPKNRSHVHNPDAPLYLHLGVAGAYYRLHVLRSTVAEAKARKPALPPSMIPADWREARRYGFHNWAAAHAAMAQGTNGDGWSKEPIWYTHCGEYFRDERDACKVYDRLPRGWYTNMDDRETACGIVARLPHGRFLAGYRWTSNDERVWFGQVYDDEKEAALAADNHAERFANMAREDDAAFQEAAELDMQRDELGTRVRELIVLRNVACMSYARNELRRAIASLREVREELRSHPRGAEFI